MNKQCLLYLGNGFDVAHGYQTRYKDFYNSKIDELKSSANKGNLLFQHIISRITGEYWQDLERGLYEYSKELTEQYNEGNVQSAKQFEEEFVELKKLLFNYLQNPPKIEKTNPGWVIKELSNEWHKLDCHVVSFNYTYFAAAYTSEAVDNSSGLSFDSKVITYQHGMINNPNPYRANSYEDIVVGIDESQKVEELHSFLYKTSQRISSVHQLTQRVRGADVFIIYGCSMGESDRFYFKNLFDKRKTNNQYIVYAFGDKERAKLNNTIRGYTGGLAAFQDEYHNNVVNIIDSSNENSAIQETRRIMNSILIEPSF